MRDGYGMVWHRADWDLPATHIETREESGPVYDVLISDPLLVWTTACERIVAVWEEDDELGFRGWWDPHSGETLDGVTHWRQLPDPPEGCHA